MIAAVLKFSIQHRWTMLGLTFLMGCLGIYNLTRLHIDAVPDITNTQVLVTVQAPGFSALEIEQRITFPLETGMAGLPRLEKTRSLSQYGISLITMIFEDGTDIYFARRAVSERMQELKAQLPAGVEPVMGPIATGLGEIFMWTIEARPDAKKPDGTPYDLTDLRTIQDWVIRPQLRNTPGVTEINTIGGYVKQFHVTPDPYKLIGQGLTFKDVIAALAANNSDVGAGYIERSNGQYLVRVPGQVTDLKDIENITVRSIRGIPILIRDVATVHLGKELRLGAATRFGEETVLGTVFMLVGENSRVVAQRVAKNLEEINRSLPEGVTAKPVYDRTTLVDKTIRTVSKSLTEGALLVNVILFLFLGNMRAAFITALVIPLSMLFTVTGMVTGNLTANLMSLGALDFGIIVDGAVVIVENCARKLTEATKNLGRALTDSERIDVIWEASQEVRKPMLFGEMIIMIVYFPILTLTGVEGKTFTPMALTVLLALTGALILSFTFVPAAVALVLCHSKVDRENFISGKVKQVYYPILRFLIKNRLVVVVSAAMIVIVSISAARHLGSEFIPSLDEGDVAIHTLRVPETSLSQALELQSVLEKHLTKRFPQIETIVGKVGTSEVATEPHPPSIGENTVIMKPRSEWPDPNLPKAELMRQLEEEAGKLLGSNYEFTQPIRMRFNHLLSGVFSDVAVKIFGDDMNVMLEQAEKAADILRKIPGAADIKVEQVSGLPILTVKLNRPALSRYGLNASDVQETIEVAVGGKPVGLVFEGDRRFDIVVRLPESLRNDVEALKQLPIPLPQYEVLTTSTGEKTQPSRPGLDITPQLPASIGVDQDRLYRTFVKLDGIADVAVVVGPNQISREDGKRRIVVTCNVRDRDLGSFVEEAQQRIAEGLKLPAGYWITWGGEFEQLLSAAKRLEVVIPLTLFFILALLFTALRSLKDALLVFTGVPLALTGGIAALWLRDIPLSISAAVGFIALSGVAVLNGLVMITFIKKLREDGKSVDEAILEGSLTRLRPVLMTALVASLGFLPMAIATGTGAEVQRPLATVVIGGLISSTLLTLGVLPALYSLVESRKEAKSS